MFGMVCVRFEDLGTVGNVEGISMSPNIRERGLVIRNRPRTPSYET